MAVARQARRVAALAVLILAAGLTLPALAALTFPPLTGRIVDQAGIIPADARAQLDSKLAALEEKTTDQLVVVTLSSLQGTDIADYGYQLGRAWGIGQKGKNNGALLIIVPSEHDVRIEVGYGLEGDLTDAVSRLIIENAMLPRFRANDYPGGIERGVDDIIQVLSGDAAAFKERAAERPEAKGGGLNPFLIFGIIAVFWIIGSHFFGRRRRGPWGWYGGGLGAGTGASSGCSGSTT
jgi:uncharacterized protein